MRLVALVCSVMAACGGGGARPVAPKPTPDPIPNTAGPSCKEVTVHLATLAERDPAEDAKVNESLRARCESDGWSDEARSCLATASSDEELDGCKTKLTVQQLTAFPRQEKPADPWSSPKDGDGKDSKDRKDGTKRKTRGFAPKDKAHSKDGDPCEGGE
jgi:hypothetical protein